MDIAVIGSMAAKMHGLELGHQADMDIICKYDDLKHITRKLSASCKIIQQYPIDDGKVIFAKNKEGQIFEFSIAWEGSMAEKLLHFIYESEDWAYDEFHGMAVIKPSLDILYMLKMSHRYKKNSPHFLKTMSDIKKLREKGCVIKPDHLEFYRQREKETYNYAHPKLNVKKEDFFTETEEGTLRYVYDHDSIHEAVKHLANPAYTYFKPTLSEVNTCEEMFNALDEHTKLLSVLEESYVLAIERSQVPYPATDRYRSFSMALEKVCTSIASGRWREFAWENYDKVNAMYEETYVDRFRYGVDYGVVQPYKGKVAY